MKSGEFHTVDRCRPLSDHLGLTGKVDKTTAKADYTLKIKACNPRCK